MNVRKIAIVLLSVVMISVPAAAKVRISGRVSDGKGEVVAGALLQGMSGQKVVSHALSDEEGRYELILPDSLLKRGVATITSLGFAPLTIGLSKLVKSPDIELKREVSELAEAEVKGKKRKVKRPDWIGNATIYEANVRQSSSERNFFGLLKRLPDLMEMGVNVVCLLPIHPISQKNRRGTLGWAYAVSDYEGINADYGTLDDLKHFVLIAHMLGLRVILDEACGFSGCDHPWVESHPEYYARTDSGEFVSPAGRPDVYKFDYGNPEWRRAMIESLRYWVKEADIDGYRFSMAEELPEDFWVRARKTVQQEKPVVFIAEASEPGFLKEAFDMDYGWAVTDTLTALAATQGVNRYAYAHHIPMPSAQAESVLNALKRQGKRLARGRCMFT